MMWNSSQSCIAPFETIGGASSTQSCSGTRTTPNIRDIMGWGRSARAASATHQVAGATTSCLASCPGVKTRIHRIV